MVVHAEAQSTSQLVSRAVSDLARQTGFPIAFGGLAEQGEIRVSAIVGARSHSIDGLVVRAERGLGGRAFVEGRPRLALDYRTARGITHDYDRAILGEGIATLFAVPVVAAGRTRGVLYCGSWSQAGLDAAVARPALRVAEELATELRIRDEVDRRVAMSAPRSDQRLPAATREELRESYANLRSIAADVADPALRTRIAAVERRIAALTAEPVEQAPASEVRLSPRELDVLSHAAMGSTNAEISEALGLRETTVKSYLATAMAKFDASTRHAAVTAARRAGLLP